MRKLLKKLYIAAFFIVSVLPFALMGVIDGAVSENRVVSVMPKLMNEDGSFNTKFFEGLDTYVTQHFAFRDKLLNLDSNIKINVFKSPSDSQVILGKEGWLFFDLALPCYMGRNLPDEEIQAVADKMTQASQYIEGLGKTPVFLIVPNKSTIYPELMPDKFGEKGEENDLDYLMTLMDERGINYLNAKKALKEGKLRDIMYLPEDTHWNNTGARLILNKLFEKLGLTERYDLELYTIENTHEPDLYNILHPDSGYLEEQRIYPDIGEFEYGGRFRTIDDLEIKTHNGSGNGKSLFMYRDSFGRAIIPYLGQVFSDCGFSRSSPYDITLVKDTPYDFVVIEIGERNLGNLKDMIVD